MMETTPKRVKLTTEVRQADLVQAALRLAAQHSPQNVTTTALAKVVGITQGAVFRHFASKEAIWSAAVDWATATLMRQLRAVAAPYADAPNPQPLLALQAVFKAHVDFVANHPGVPRIIFQELQHAHESPLKLRVRELMEQYQALIATLLAQARKQDLLHPQTDVSAAASLFIGSIQGLVMQALLSGRVSAIREQAPGVFTLYLRAITSKDAPCKTPA